MVTLSYSFIHSFTIKEKRHGVVHLLQNLKNCIKGKASFKSYPNSYPRIRIKVSADNEGAMHFEYLPA